ncbi:carbohydrate kinase family protein [Spirilliplanes yamanashiensis]|uniref:Ribokinase n=1 Tax=Spirilliplanes yamanashiensis TaxID=42233 RepID=A0A8J4DI45_9ACTN|nr:carbohydrate kinase family protein [Spirilliplanes yamanashiensis]MDP9819528.1 sugar/nucleoside kinase (ribokinase family) [Spirilliplanes yamanashiensis]GIJ01650.1 ribokinase [Spirilliplanes yamanashiensis]
MPDLVVVGDLVTDVLALTAGPPEPGTDTTGTIRFTGGGQAANTAAWLAAAGCAVTLVAAVGDDAEGRDRVAELTAAGVRCAVRAYPDRTGTVLVLAAAGERTMIADRGANLRLSPADVDAGLAAAPAATHLHLSGYVLLDAASRPAGRHALAAARARGLTVSVDAASAGPLRRTPGFAGWVRGADLLLANDDEAAVLGDVHTLAREVVVKRGAAGASWGTEHCPARDVPVLDATGAGDAFAAGLLAAWLGGADRAAALAAGVAYGARAVQTPGSRP